VKGEKLGEGSCTLELQMRAGEKASQSEHDHARIEDEGV
jgi:hypothetical protein